MWCQRDPAQMHDAKAASRLTAGQYRSETMPKGYFFVEIEISDPAAYEAYRTSVPDIIAAHGGRILVRGEDAQPLDGVIPHRRRVIVEFDSCHCRKLNPAS